MGNWVGLCAELAQSDVGRQCQYFYWNSYNIVRVRLKNGPMNVALFG